jgi:hypothetical protein
MIPIIVLSSTNFDNFLKVCTSLQKNRRSSKGQVLTGWKEKKGETEELDQFQEKEKNFVTTYNHFLNKEIPVCEEV